MSRKITISVPDILYKKIDAWRQAFNLSHIFQEAISEAIKKKEEFQKRISEDFSIPEIIERLKKEKIESEDTWYRQGERSGLEWAHHAHYLDLKNVLRQPVDAFAGPGGSLRDYFKTTFEQEKPGQCRKFFLSGWKQGVNDFWNIIKGKLEEK